MLQAKGWCFDVLVAALKHMDAHRLLCGSASSTEMPICIHNRMRYLTLTQRLAAMHCAHDEESLAVGVAVRTADAPNMHSLPIRLKAVIYCQDFKMSIRKAASLCGVSKSSVQR